MEEVQDKIKDNIVNYKSEIFPKQCYGWKRGVDFPEWMDIFGLKTINKGYLIENETPRDAYKRVSRAVSKRLGKPEMADKFFDYIWKGWLCLASPVLSNTGTKRGLPISCFTIDVGDSIKSISGSIPELMLLTKMGGGVGINLNRIRCAGSKISGGGESNGVIPFCKIHDSTILATSQGGVRRGAASVNLNVRHGDIKPFLKIRRPQGDVNTQCLNLNHCVNIPDEFMEGLFDNEEDMDLWIEILKTRIETGEPYIMYGDNVNNANPLAYKNNGLRVDATNICSEITLFTDEDHSFVCCLSSLNLARYNEWKDTDLVKDAIWFLDGVLQEFIDKISDTIMINDSKLKKVQKKLSNYVTSREGINNLMIELNKIVGENIYFRKTLASAKKGRALGLGVLGWHSFLQRNMISMEDGLAKSYNKVIFKNIKEKALLASQELAQEYGEPEWCKGTGLRNSHLLATAPTTSNAILAGTSPTIEPWIANSYAQPSAKGTFVRRNLALYELVAKKYPEYNNREFWNQLMVDDGSIADFDFFTDAERKVFKTFYELNQNTLVDLAADRQKYICQSQSLNLAFKPDEDALFLHEVHYNAWKKGIKTLYYVRSRSAIKGDDTTRTSTECLSCEG